MNYFAMHKNNVPLQTEQKQKEMKIQRPSWKSGYRNQGESVSTSR